MMELLHFELFFGIRIIDVVDYALVALIIYQLYKTFKGSLAFSILLGLFTLLLAWLLVKKLDMRILSSLLGYFMQIGPLAILIVFQQEVRKFLLLIGKNSLLNDRVSLKQVLPWKWNREDTHHTNFEVVLDCCQELSRRRIGAIIVFANTSELKFVASSGEMIDANITRHILECIFAKNSPLHDGAVIIANNRIKSAGAVLPVTENPDMPVNVGLRHKAAVGITEQTDAVVVIVSEQTGKISMAHEGQLILDTNTKIILDVLHAEFPIKESA